MSKPLIIIGSGGHASVLVDAIFLLKRKIIGATTINDAKKKFPVEIIGNDDVLEKYFPAEIELVNGLGQLPNSNLREKIFRTYKSMNYNFMTLIHPGAIIATNVKLSEGVQIMAGAVIQSGVIIGSNSIINTKVSIDHDSTIGKNCHIAPGVTICGNVNIEDNSFIGAGSTIIQNLHIPESSIIPAGTVLIKT